LKRHCDAMPAHARRIRQTLEWFSADRPSSRVFYRGELLGTWGELQPNWQWCGSAFRIQFQQITGVPGFWATSVKWPEDGVAILQGVSHGGPGETLVVTWLEKGVRQNEPNLLQDIRSWLKSEFMGSSIVSVSNRPDLAHSLSGNYHRIRFRQGGQDRFLLAGSRSLSADDAPLCVTHALLWLISMGRKERFAPVPNFHLLVPDGKGGTLQHRAAMLNPARIKMRVWEYQGEGESFQAKRSAAQKTPVEEFDFRWPLLGPFQWSPLLARVLDLAPELIRRYPRFQDYDSLRLAGLEFARALGPERDRILFGVGSDRVEVTPDNFADLTALVGEILYYRRPDSPDTSHIYYRLQAERWLEALILENIPMLFPELQQESVYSQIPVYLGQQAGRVDILGVDREGTLVVLELKVTADPHLPVQGLDYWSRVIAHNQNGDFERRGYFASVRLNRRRPKIYLVAPVFDFHDSTEKIVSYLNPGLEVWKIGINQDWRCGVKILRRVRVPCGKPR
jgi:hypothetical protein